MLLLPLLLLIQSTYSILVGTLSNVTYQSNDSIPIIFYGTCRECVCQAFISGMPFIYVAFNCYANARECHLFHNFSASYQLVTNASAQFFFYPNLPLLETLTTRNLFSHYWNYTGITVAGITGSPGTGASQLTNPFGVTLDPSNTLYIADRGNSRIQKWLMSASSGTTVAGQRNGTMGVALNCLNEPGNVEIDSSGNLYITEIFNFRVLFWPNGTSAGTIVAGNGKSSFLKLC